MLYGGGGAGIRELEAPSCGEGSACTLLPLSLMVSVMMVGYKARIGLGFRAGISEARIN